MTVGLGVIWQCIAFYVSFFGDSGDGIFYSILWVAQKVAQNCAERGI